MHSYMLYVLKKLYGYSVKCYYISQIKTFSLKNIYDKTLYEPFVQMSAFYIINFDPEIPLILLLCSQMSLNFPFICLGKIRKMSLKVLECLGFQFLNLCGHHVFIQVWKSYVGINSTQKHSKNISTKVLVVVVQRTQKCN